VRRVPLKNMALTSVNGALYAKFYVEPILLKPSTTIAKLVGSRAEVVHKRSGSLTATDSLGRRSVTEFDTFQIKDEPNWLVVSVPQEARSIRITVVEDCVEELYLHNRLIELSRLCFIRHESGDVAVEDVGRSVSARAGAQEKKPE
jgi:hypothetical protein